MKVNYKKSLRITFTLLSFLWITGSIAQQYQPLPESNAEWDIVWYKDPQGWVGDNPFLFHYKYRILKDTIIDNKTYQVYNKTNYNTTCSFDSIVESSLFFLRNDSNNKIVFILNGNEEKELYNFNLTVGDTLNGIIFSHYPDIHYTVGSIDSVLVINDYHKRFILNREGYFMHNYLIEGVGYSWGLIEEAPTGFWPFYDLRCFHNNNQLGYIYSNTGECLLETDTCYVSVNQYQPNNEIDIYPNPALDYVRIKFNKSKWLHLPMLVRLYNSSGILLFEKNIIQAEDEITIKMDEFGPGVIIYQITCNNEVQYGKIIHQ